MLLATQTTQNDEIRGNAMKKIEIGKATAVMCQVRYMSNEWYGNCRTNKEVTFGDQYQFQIDTKTDSICQKKVASNNYIEEIPNLFLSVRKLLLLITISQIDGKCGDMRNTFETKPNSRVDVP